MGYPRKIVLFSRRLRTLLANERKSARQPDPRRASGIVQTLNWLTRPVYSSGDPLRSPCLGSSLSSISLAVSFASRVPCGRPSPSSSIHLAPYLHGIDPRGRPCASAMNYSPHVIHGDLSQ